MAFDWDGYLMLARTLKSETDGQISTTETEAKRRSAVSRAYYAMYHLGVTYAKDNLGFSPTITGPNQGHSEIQGVYRRQFGSVQLQEVKPILYRLHKARKDCDYEDKDLGNLETLLESVILDAERMKAILST